MRRAPAKARFIMGFALRAKRGEGSFPSPTSKARRAPSPFGALAARSPRRFRTHPGGEVPASRYAKSTFMPARRFPLSMQRACGIPDYSAPHASRWKGCLQYERPAAQRLRGPPSSTGVHPSRAEVVLVRDRGVAASNNRSRNMNPRHSDVARFRSLVTCRSDVHGSLEERVTIRSGRSGAWGAVA